MPNDTRTIDRSDADLIRAASADAATFGLVYERHALQVFMWCRRRLEWAASDLTAETFAQAWLARAHPVGTILEVHGAPGERIKGSFDGIEQDGAMRLRRDGMIDIIRSGDVLLR